MNIKPTDTYLGDIVDSRPGFYYVSASDAGKWWSMSGPFTTHAEALERVEPVRKECNRLDPRSAFVAFGTVRCETTLGPGRLDRISA